MVQLSPSLDVQHPPERSERGEEKLENPDQVAPGGLSGGPNSPQPSLEVSTVYYGYETYIEDGLICLKHKIRNLEKKKLKLKEYQRRLSHGEVLNRDQMAAVEKYAEVIHHLEFAQELHRSLDGLTQTLLKAQRKAVKKEQVLKTDAERRRLTMVLRVQNLLAALQQEDVQRDLLVGRNWAPLVSAQQLQRLNQLAALLGVQRDDGLSLEEQTERAALVYMDLLDGNEKPVAGSSYKHMKEELDRLLNSTYFICLPPPPSRTPEPSQSTATMPKPKTDKVSKEFFNRVYVTEVDKPSSQDWKEDFQALKDREPPDNWDVEFADGPPSPQTSVHKPWRRAADFIPKVVPVTSKKQSDCRQRKDKKTKGEHDKSALQMDIPVEVCSSLSAFPKDPALRKQHLEDLMAKIHGSFSFMQDSLLDGDSSSNSQPPLQKRPSRAPSPLAQGGLRSSSDVIPKAMHSTPLPPRVMERKTSLTSGKPSLDTSDVDLPSKDLHHEQLAERQMFSSPPLYRRNSAASALDENFCPSMVVADSGKRPPCNGVRSCTSTPPPADSFPTPPTRRALGSSQFHAVFKAGAALAHNRELDYQPSSESRHSTVGTQTPAEFAPSEDPQLVFQSDFTAGSGERSFLSPGQTGVSRSSQYYRGSVRGASYIPQTRLRESGPFLYTTREPGYQHMYRRGERRSPSAAWSDSSQVSSPDREGTFITMDSGRGDSMSVSTATTLPLTPHSHHTAALLPMQLYPLSQPLRVAFTASRTANFAPGNLDQPIVFDQLHSNLGEMYDAHIGRFTCPVNGTYVFIFHILKLAVNVPLYVNLMCNEEVMVSAYANDGAPDHETASNHAILPLFQGDQVWLRLHRGAIYGSTWKYSTFSGFLLYQD